MIKKTGRARGNEKGREIDVETSDKLKEFMSNATLWTKLRRGKSHLRWCNLLKRLRKWHPEIVKVKCNCSLFCTQSEQSIKFNYRDKTVTKLSLGVFGLKFLYFYQAYVTYFFTALTVVDVLIIISVLHVILSDVDVALHSYSMCAGVPTHPVPAFSPAYDTGGPKERDFAVACHHFHSRSLYQIQEQIRTAFSGSGVTSMEMAF